jgi:rare lipoprotein A
VPLGTMLRVENLANGRSIVVRINDRGPFVGRRIIDLSMAAARRIDLKDRGTGQVALSLVAAR